MKKIIALLLLLSVLLCACLPANDWEDLFPTGTESSGSSSEATQDTQESTEVTEDTEPSEETEPSEDTEPSEETEPSEAPTEPTANTTVTTQPSTQPSDPGTTSGSFRVHYIDVGQADSILVECDGEYMLIDGGNKDDGQLVVSYLMDAGVEQIHTVVSTHPHEDHVGGLASVMAVFPVGQVFSPTRSYSSKAFDNFAKYVDQQRLEMVKPAPGHKFNIGSAQVTVLGPVDSYSDVNNTSIVLMVQYGNTRFLFTGDQETDAETDLLNSGADVKADVLKVGHHGSNTSTGYRFLREVAPKYAIISCGKGNSYGHPHEEPLSRLHDAEVSVYRTDTMGHIVVTSDGTNITFSWQKTSAKPT